MPVAEPLPADRCPYAKPFPDDFAECPAYQPTRFIPLDTAFRPLKPIWSCAHLDVGRIDGRAYTLCRLGSAEARQEWAARIRSERLERWRAVAREFGEALMEPLATLYAAKARQVAGRGTPEGKEADRELRRAVKAFLDLDFEMMDGRATELEAIGFPVAAMKVVTKDAMDKLLARSQVFGGYEPPAELLAPFSAEIADFVRGLFVSPASA